MDSSSGVAGGARLMNPNCNRCYLLIGEFKRQMTAFETLAGYNSMLTSNFLIQTLREVIGKFQTGDNLGFDACQRPKVPCADQSTSTDAFPFPFPTNPDPDSANGAQNDLQFRSNYEIDPHLHIKQEEEDDSAPPILIPQVETENRNVSSSGTRTRRERRTTTHNYSLLGNEDEDEESELAPTTTTTTITRRGRVVKQTQRNFMRKKPWAAAGSKRNNIKISGKKGRGGGGGRPRTTGPPRSADHRQNEVENQIPQTNFTPLTTERLREANEHIRGIRKIDEEGRHRTFYECTICRKSMTVKINAAFHVRRVHFQERLVCPFASSGCTQMFYDCRLQHNHRRKCPFKPSSDISSFFVNTPASARARTQTVTSNMKNSLDFATTKTKISRPRKTPVKIERQSKSASAKSNNSIVVSNPFPNFDLSTTLNVKVEVERLCLVSPQPSNVLKFITENVEIKKEEEQEQVGEEGNETEIQKTEADGQKVEVEREKSFSVKSNGTPRFGLKCTSQSNRNVSSKKSALLSSPAHSNAVVVDDQMDLHLGLQMELGQEEGGGGEKDGNYNGAGVDLEEQDVELMSQHQTGILFVTEEEFAEAMKGEEEMKNKQLEDDRHLANKIEEEMELLHR